jgi:hypothetical protein
VLRERAGRAHVSEKGRVIHSNQDPLFFNSFGPPHAPGHIDHPPHHACVARLGAGLIGRPTYAP